MVPQILLMLPIFFGQKQTVWPGSQDILQAKQRSRQTGEQENFPAPTAAPLRSWTERLEALHLEKLEPWWPGCRVLVSFFAWSLVPGEIVQKIFMLSSKPVPRARSTTFAGQLGGLS